MLVKNFSQNFKINIEQNNVKIENHLLRKQSKSHLCSKWLIYFISPIFSLCTENIAQSLSIDWSCKDMLKTYQRETKLFEFEGKKEQCHFPIFVAKVYNCYNCQIKQNKEITAPYKHEKNLKELLIRPDPYNIIDNVGDKMHTNFQCNKQCDSFKNFAVTKNSFECFATKRVYILVGLPHVLLKM